MRGLSSPPYVISIHPMLRFNVNESRKLCRCSIISIHPMLRFNISRNIWLKDKEKHFNTSYVTVQRTLLKTIKIYNIISIHPMLRFNLAILNTIMNNSIISIHPMLRFNKSQISPVLLIRYISIHPMLRFNYVHKGEKKNGKKFQYILCYGSTL